MIYYYRALERWEIGVSDSFFFNCLPWALPSCRPHRPNMKYEYKVIGINIIIRFKYKNAMKEREREKKKRPSPHAPFSHIFLCMQFTIKIIELYPLLPISFTHTCRAIDLCFFCCSTLTDLVTQSTLQTIGPPPTPTKYIFKNKTRKSELSITRPNSFL